MWINTAPVIWAVLCLFMTEEASGIYTGPPRPNLGHSTKVSGSSLAPQLYSYLKGYYQTAQNNKNNGPPVPPHVQNPSSFAQPRVNFLEKYRQDQRRAYFQPKSSLGVANRFNPAQSREYLSKLRQLADLLKSRVASRANAQPAQPPQQVRQYAPAPAPVIQQYTSNVQSRSPQPPPQQQPYNRAQIPQIPVVSAAAPYGTPPPAAPPKGSYSQPQIQSPKIQVIIPRPMSYQSMGLPQPTASRPTPPKPVITSPPPTTKPQMDTETLVKILKASYASLLPLLMNQAKMTSYGVQKIPLYGSNPYQVFGPMTYGPLPKPNQGSMQLSYTKPQSLPSQPQLSGSSYNVGSAHRSTGSFGSGPSYGSSGGSGGSSYSGSSSSYGGSSYGSSSYGSSYDSSSYDLSPEVMCGPISGAFCQGRETGLYSHPASGQCFVQCDHVGQGHPQSCSPGTSWKSLGPEPALFNYCS